MKVKVTFKLNEALNCLRVLRETTLPDFLPPLFSSLKSLKMSLGVFQINQFTSVHALVEMLVLQKTLNMKHFTELSCVAFCFNLAFISIIMIMIMIMVIIIMIIIIITKMTKQ